MRTFEKTDGLALRVAPFSNTSLVVTWLTAARGRLVTVVKGALRPKSAFLGQIDLFYTCELVFYARERDGIHVLKECAALKTRGAFRCDWRAAAGASYLCDVAARASVAADPNPQLHGLLEACFDQFCRSGANLSLLFWAELKLMAALGMMPELGRCVACAGTRASGADGGTARFSHARGGMLCCACAAGAAAETVPVQPDVLAMLRHWQRSGHPRMAANTQCEGRQASAIESLLGRFLQYHLDMSLRSRSIALRLMKEPSCP